MAYFGLLFQDQRLCFWTLPILFRTRAIRKISPLSPPWFFGIPVAVFPVLTCEIAAERCFFFPLLQH